MVKRHSGIPTESINYRYGLTDYWDKKPVNPLWEIRIFNLPNLSPSNPLILKKNALKAISQSFAYIKKAWSCIETRLLCCLVVMILLSALRFAFRRQVGNHVSTFLFSQLDTTNVILHCVDLENSLSPLFLPVCGRLIVSKNMNHCILLYMYSFFPPFFLL